MLRIVLVVVAVIGVGLKMLVGSAPDPRSPVYLVDLLVRLLIKSGYQVNEVASPAEPKVAARKGSCELHILEARPQGWNSSSLAQLRRTGDTFVFAYAGALTADLPVYGATWDYQFARIKRQVGMKAKWCPVLAVVASSDCDIEAFPWSEVCE